MSASTKISSNNADTSTELKLKVKTYFSWSKKLWYILDVSKDGEMAFIEDCKTRKVRWIKTELFLADMKEVELVALPMSDWD
jgi:hypothetical protein